MFTSYSDPHLTILINHKWWPNKYMHTIMQPIFLPTNIQRKVNSWLISPGHQAWGSYFVLFTVIQVSFPVGIAPQVECGLICMFPRNLFPWIWSFCIHWCIWQPWGLASEVVHCQMSGIVIFYNFWGHCFQILFQNGLSSTGPIWHSTERSWEEGWYQASRDQGSRDLQCCEVFVSW